MVEAYNPEVTRQYHFHIIMEQYSNIFLIIIYLCTNYGKI